ncbi:MAG TPA: PadR family transcriptional regulator [Pseudoxanthomonas sp.]
MKTSTPTLLGHALLGLLLPGPASGYDLRQIFVRTPMASFSDSPGAIYPALARLEKGGLVTSRVDPSTGLRLRRLYALTEAGRNRLRAWVAQPITREDVVSDMDGLLLRFAFLDGAGATARAPTFLRELQVTLEAYLSELRAYLAKHGPVTPLTGRLALENGLRGYEAHLRWAMRSQASFPAIETP